MSDRQKSQTRVSQNKYRFVMKKGSGAFADVIQAENTRTGQMVAIKRMKQTYKSVQQIQQLREIQSLKVLRHHPNIVQLQEILFDKQTGKLALVFELMSHDMYQTIRNRKQPLPLRQVQWYMFQVINGLRGAHDAGFFHRDIKPENVLIRRSPRTDSWLGDVVKLSDFGSARQVGSSLPYTEYISTRWYRPPETLLSDGVYGKEMDIFGIGCVLYEMLELHPLFPGKDELDQVQRIHSVLGTPDPEVLHRIRRGAKNNPIRQEFPPVQGCGVGRLMTSTACGAARLIEQMLTYDPQRRISAAQALASEYFDDFLEVTADVRHAGFVEEAYIAQMETAWRDVRGIAQKPAESSKPKVPAGMPRQDIRQQLHKAGALHRDFENEVRGFGELPAKSLSPKKQYGEIHHKVKKVKPRDGASVQTVPQKGGYFNLQVNNIKMAQQSLPELKKKYYYRVGK